MRPTIPIDDLPLPNPNGHWADCRCEECAVAFKTKLIDGWQARNKALERMYDRPREREAMASRHFWRRLWVRFARLWRWI